MASSAFRGFKWALAFDTGIAALQVVYNLLVHSYWFSAKDARDVVGIFCIVWFLYTIAFVEGRQAADFANMQKQLEELRAEIEDIKLVG